MTWVEIISGICVIGILAAIVAPAIYQRYYTIGCGPSMYLSGVRQLHMATQQMTIDNKTTGSSPVAWTCDGTTPITYEQWKAMLVDGYLQPQDLDKLLTAIGPVKEAYTVFAVTEDDPEKTVLFASKNWHGLHSSKLSDEPFKGRGFVVFRKDGSGAVIMAKQIKQADLIGEGGSHEFLPLK
jgi:hypothetical protein